jgi:hypothetical protein
VRLRIPVPGDAPAFSIVGFFYTLRRVLPWDFNDEFVFLFNKQWVDAGRR